MPYLEECKDSTPADCRWAWEYENVRHKDLVPVLVSKQVREQTCHETWFTLDTTMRKDGVHKGWWASKRVSWKIKYPWRFPASRQFEKLLLCQSEHPALLRLPSCKSERHASGWPRVAWIQPEVWYISQGKWQVGRLLAAVTRIVHIYLKGLNNYARYNKSGKKVCPNSRCSDFSNASLSRLTSLHKECLSKESEVWRGVTDAGRSTKFEFFIPVYKETLCTIWVDPGDLCRSWR